MSEYFTVDGKKFRLSDLAETGKLNLKNLLFTNDKLLELKNNLAIATKARNSYIADLKTEVVQNRTGINIADMFTD